MKSTDVVIARIVKTQTVVPRGTVGQEQPAEMKARPVDVRLELVIIDWFMEQDEEQ